MLAKTVTYSSQNYAGTLGSGLVNDKTLVLINVSSIHVFY